MIRIPWSEIFLMKITRILAQKEREIIISNK